jgi:predicted nucleic acid-binding protein
VIVVDASVLTNAFTDDGPVGTRSRAELARDAHWAAPQHLVVEVFSAVRGRWLGQQISEKRAEDALSALVTSTIDLVSATPLLTRMWELRDNVSGYDAAYLAVAETFDCALVTADARLARVPDLRCEVRLALPFS